MTKIQVNGHEIEILAFVPPLTAGDIIRFAGIDDVDSYRLAKLTIGKFGRLQSEEFAPSEEITISDGERFALHYCGPCNAA